MAGHQLNTMLCSLPTARINMFPHQNCFCLLDLFNLLLELWNLLAARNIRCEACCPNQQPKKKTNDWPGRPLLGGFQLRAGVPPSQMQTIHGWCQTHLAVCNLVDKQAQWRHLLDSFQLILQLGNLCRQDLALHFHTPKSAAPVCINRCISNKPPVLFGVSCGFKL